jgi:hypothetical protein
VVNDIPLQSAVDAALCRRTPKRADKTVGGEQVVNKPGGRSKFEVEHLRPLGRRFHRTSEGLYRPIPRSDPGLKRVLIGCSQRT